MASFSNNHHHHHHHHHHLSSAASSNNDNSSWSHGLKDWLASEFHQLPLAEQQQALNDLTGNGNDDTSLEDPSSLEMVNVLLLQMEMVLQQGNFAIYNLACQLNRAYVENPLFRLQFLRANGYDLERSIHQMIRFLSQKATYFGLDKVAQEITLEDLSEQELELMLSGLFHIQDGTDHSGRVIVHIFSHLFGKYKAESVIRVKHYIWCNILIPMPAVQQKGVVAVYWDYHHHHDSSNNMPNENLLESLAPALEYLQSVPIRYSALHICAKTNTDGTAPDSMVLTLGLNALPAYTRARTRVHQATFQELLMELREQFGLPDTFPMDENGKIRHGILNVWFHLHMAKEPFCANMNQVVVLEEGSEQVIIKDDEVDDGDDDMEASAMMMRYGPATTATTGFLMGNVFSGLIHQVLAQQSTYQLGGVSTQPQQPQRASPDHSDKDVLLGRGRDIQNHVGNVRFRDFLTLHQDEYNDAPRNQRREIALNLYNALKADGIRFLQKADNGSGWEEVSAVEGEKKIGQLFRTLRKKS